MKALRRLKLSSADSSENVGKGKGKGKANGGKEDEAAAASAAGITINLEKHVYFLKPSLAVAEGDDEYADSVSRTPAFELRGDVILQDKRPYRVEVTLKCISTTRMADGKNKIATLFERKVETEPDPGQQLDKSQNEGDFHGEWAVPFMFLVPHSAPVFMDTPDASVRQIIEVVAHGISAKGKATKKASSDNFQFVVGPAIDGDPQPGFETNLFGAQDFGIYHIRFTTRMGSCLVGALYWVYLDVEGMPENAQITSISATIDQVVIFEGQRNLRRVHLFKQNLHPDEKSSKLILEHERKKSDDTLSASIWASFPRHPLLEAATHKGTRTPIKIGHSLTVRLDYDVGGVSSWISRTVPTSLGSCKCLVASLKLPPYEEEKRPFEAVMPLTSDIPCHCEIPGSVYIEQWYKYELKIINRNEPSPDLQLPSLDLNAKDHDGCSTAEGAVYKFGKP